MQLNPYRQSQGTRVGKYVSYEAKVGSFPQVLWFPPPLKLTTTIWPQMLKEVLNHNQSIPIQSRGPEKKTQLEFDIHISIHNTPHIGWLILKGNLLRRAMNLISLWSQEFRINFNSTRTLYQSLENGIWIKMTFMKTLQKTWITSKSVYSNSGVS